MANDPTPCPRCGVPTVGPCAGCASSRPPERGAQDLLEAPLPTQTRRLISRIAFFLAAGIGALIWELVVRRQPG